MEADFSDSKSKLALQARIRYISKRLSNEEIAKIVGVSKEDVDLFEQNELVNPVTKRKLLNAYMYKNTINQYLFDRFYRS